MGERREAEGWKTRPDIYLKKFELLHVRGEPGKTASGDFAFHYSRANEVTVISRGKR